MKFQKSRLEPLTLTIGGNDYPAFLTNSGMMELEQLTGKEFAEIFEMFASSKYGTKDLMATTYVLLKGGGVELTLEDLDSEPFNVGVIEVLLTALNNYGHVESSMESTEGEGKKKTRAK